METLMRQFIAASERSRRRDFNENRARNLIRRYYSKSKLGKAPINFNDPTNAFVYVKLFGAIHATATNEAFKELVTNSTYAEWKKRLSGEVVVLALGGGPGTDLFGIIPVLDSASLPVKKIRCVVVDLCSGWEPLCRELMAFLQRQVSRQLQLEFYAIDMAGSDLRKVAGLLAEADIVCMVKFISAFSRGVEDVTRLGKMVFRDLKPGSIVFYLDGSGARENLGALTRSAEFGPIIRRKKTFQLTSAETESNLWKQNHSCSTYCFWIKPSAISPCWQHGRMDNTAQSMYRAPLGGVSQLLSGVLTDVGNQRTYPTTSSIRAVDEARGPSISTTRPTSTRPPNAKMNVRRDSTSAVNVKARSQMDSSTSTPTRAISGVDSRESPPLTSIPASGRTQNVRWYENKDLVPGLFPKDNLRSSTANPTMASSSRPQTSASQQQYGHAVRSQPSSNRNMATSQQEGHEQRSKISNDWPDDQGEKSNSCCGFCTIS